MPNPDHLAILREGVNAWNRWRLKNKVEQPDLVWADLTGANLRQANLRGANLRQAYLTRTYLTGADLAGANLTGANLSGANFKQTRLTGANLTGANLTRAYLTGTNLTGADLAGADLAGADLAGADLTGMNLRQARFTRANLAGAILRQTRLKGAHLTRANLTGANLTGANLETAQLSETVFADTDFADTKGLETCHHSGPSTIDQRTLQKNPHLPDRFLRGCGLSDLEIEFAKLYRDDLSANQVTDITYKIAELRSDPAIQFHSCFISYSSHDEPFARQLHDRLQDKGVRCWFDKEDLKIGDRTRRVIHDAIRLHDKLLIILSEHSVESQWVEDEVERALEKERRDKSTVLFPIRLDETVMKIDEGWPVTVRNSRHIGDFSSWQDLGSFQSAFERLLLDLRDE